MSKKNEEVNNTLAEALARLEKKHGVGTVMRLAKGAPTFNVPTVSTGIMSIDNILGGGFAEGRVVELFGGESSGKTTLALQVIVELQKNGGRAAYIDVEHAFDLKYAQSLGVDLEQLYFSQPDSAESAMDIAKELAKTGAFQVVVLDSVASLVPSTELEGEVGKSQVGHLARFMSSALKQVIGEFYKNKTTFILINQLRMNIGVMFGNPETSPGGKALKYYATQRISLRKSTKIEDKAGNVIGHNVALKTEKNKIYMPFQKTDVPFINGFGFDAGGDVFNTAVNMDIIVKEKVTYLFEGEKLAVGESNARDIIRKDKVLQDKVKAAIIKARTKPE